jgi:hypothetical protein
MRRMMKNHYNSIRTRVLTITMGIFLTISFMGCTDPIVAKMEAEHRRLGNEAKYELQQCPSSFSSLSQTEAFYTAP